MKKIIINCCLKCGRKYDRKHKKVMGAWIGKCDICNEEGVPCASAPHDFGLYSTKEIELNDKVQDLI